MNIVHTHSPKDGFTLMEILISVSVLVILGALAVIAFSGSQKDTVLKSRANTLVFHLEEARTEAVSGKNGESHGIVFEENSYTLFSGSTYDSEDPENTTYEIEEGLELTASDDTIIFERVSGNTEGAATITVSYVDESTESINILVSRLGAVTTTD